MKAFTKASLLSMALALASVVNCDEATAVKTNMAAMPNLANMANMQHGVALTQRGPHGGWRAHGGHFGHRGVLNAGSGTAAAASCGADETKCGDFCADLEANLNFCGTCDNECPWEGSCDDGVCVCPDDKHCQLGDTCVDSMTNNAACGESCEACEFPQICSGGHCACPDPDYPEFCEYENGIVGHCTQLTDQDNCGRCNLQCPQYNGELGFGASTCDQGTCTCDDGGQTLCGATDTFGGFCVDTLTNDNYCGVTCEDAIACREGSTCINGKCSKPCNGVECESGGPVPCEGAPGSTCSCAMTPTGPTFCIATFGTDVCNDDTACDTDEECGPGSICFTNTCFGECNTRYGVCRPVDDACNSYYPS